MNKFIFRLLLLAILVVGSISVEAATSTNAVAPITATGSSTAASVFRMIGALCLVFALFFGAAWLFRNWSRLQGGRSPQRKLHVLEARTLGARQSILVVAYEKQRFLLGTTPQGITLLSALPETQESAEAAPSIIPLPFPEALMQALGRK